MATISTLAIKLTATAAGVLPAFQQVEQGARKVDSAVANAGANMASAGSGLASLARNAAMFLGIATSFGGLGFAVQMAADAETAQVAFDVMLGGAEKALAVMGDLRAFAASTPFEFPELRTAAQKLISFGFSAKQLMPTLKSVGDLSAGLGIPIGELAELYGKAKVQGRLFMEDINQLTGRGIPIIGALAKQFGVAESQVRKLVETGRVNFGNLEAAFLSLTGEGGKFGGMMDRMSQTLSGKFSTLKDNVGNLFLVIGEKLLPVIGKLADAALALTNQLQGMDDAQVQSIVRGVAFAAAFTTALVVIPRVVQAITGIIGVLRALASAQLLAQVASGPKGWATALASLAVAGVAVGGLEMAFAGITSQAEAAAQSVANVGAAAEAAADKQVKALDRVAEHQKAMQTFDETMAAGAAAAYARDVALADKWFERTRTDAEKLANDIRQVNYLHSMGLMMDDTYKRASELLRKEADGGAFEQLQQKAKTLAESLKTPRDVLRDEMASLQELLSNKLLTGEQVDKLEKLAGDRFRQAQKADERFRGATGGTAAATFGTSAEIQARKQGDDLLRQLVAQAKAEAAAAAKSNEILDDVRKELRNNRPPKINKVDGV